MGSGRAVSRTFRRIVQATKEPAHVSRLSFFSFQMLFSAYRTSAGECAYGIGYVRGSKHADAFS